VTVFVVVVVKQNFMLRTSKL